jgi:hypothetical protein
MNKEKFLSAEIKNISQVYFGKREHCRCGCGGTYTSTSYMEAARSEVNDKLVATRLKRAKKLVLEGANVDYGDTYVDVQTCANRTLTFYFDDLKDKRSSIM